jgi:hypothetical protein
MRPPPSSQSHRLKAASGAVKRWREAMSCWTIAELMHLTRDELCDLVARIEQALPDLEAGSVGRLDALTSLENIRKVMVLRDLHP